MFEFMSTRTKILGGITLLAAAGAVISGVCDYRKENAAPCCGCCDGENAVQPVLDAATETTEQIVGG
ncbi:MAG: hypothetical protein NC548_06355 [Lachnospiraceae bacterium]|nr:hypothetical protein [Lachnospiraceae bacterium]